MSQPPIPEVLQSKTYQRIVHQQSFDGQAILDGEWWYVEEWHEGFLWNRWRTLKSTSCGSSGCYTSTQTFCSEDDARKTIKRLVDGVPHNDCVWKIIEVSE